jgi:hypothetical protein
MSEQIDIAVDLGVIAPPLPEIEFLREFVANVPAAPPDKLFENRLKAGLEVFGCDPKVFTYSQPVRVPGAWRDGRLQRLVWLRN